MINSTVDREQLCRLTANIVSAYVGGNTLASEAIPAVIHSVHAALSRVGMPAEEAVELIPAVPPKRSVFPDHIICLEDGRSMIMLKRHLRAEFGLSPEGYRQKWGLPPDYPMVAPNYAKKRSNLAKASGLGRKVSRSGKPVVQGRVPYSRTAA